MEPAEPQGIRKVVFMVFFSLGSACHMTWGIWGALGVTFYVNIRGLSPKLTGTASLIALLVSAVTTPLLSLFADKYRLPVLGRRHLFLFGLPPFIGLSMLMLFHPPASLHGNALFGWLIGSMVLMKVCTPPFLNAYLAIAPEIIHNYHDRNILMSVNHITEVLTGVGFLAVIYATVMAVKEHDGVTYASGFVNPHNYNVALPILVAILLVCCEGCALYLFQFVPRLHASKVGGAAEKAAAGAHEFLHTLWAIVCFKPFWPLFITSAVNGTFGGLSEIINLITQLWFWRLEAKSLAVLQLTWLVGVATQFGATLLVYRMKWEKRNAYLVCITACIFLDTFTYLPRLLGWFPVDAEQKKVFGFLFVMNSAELAATLTCWNLLYSMYSDVTDVFAAKTGYYAEALVFSGATFALKVTSGLAHFVGGFLLSGIGWNEGPQAIQPPVVVQRLGWLNMIAPGTYVIAFLTMLFYPIDRQTHQNARELLLQREKGDATATPLMETGDEMAQLALPAEGGVGDAAEGVGDGRG